MPGSGEGLTFQEELEQDPINVARAALCFARELCYADLNVSATMTCFDLLAEMVRLEIARLPDRLARAERLADFLFRELGFKGNQESYSDPRNSYLNEVLDRRLGIPISLSVVYLAVAERLDLPAYGVGLPGHFIVAVGGPDGNVYLDPFNEGKRLSIIDCARLVETSTGHSGPFQLQWLKPARADEILARMLYNLRNIYIQRKDWQMALPVVEHLHVIQPSAPDHLRDLGTINRQIGSSMLAIDYFQRYLALAPEAEDAGLVRRNIREIGQAVSRLN
jgi:regulator of sirC expression with transglutaminase-like and TPR domain